MRVMRVPTVCFKLSGSVRSYCSPPSLWSHLTKAPLDGNHATAAACNADPNPQKVNLSRGVYKDDKGKDWKLPCVREAETIIFSQNNGHEYLGFNGLPEFTKATADFAFGAEARKTYLADRVATVQTISGTGALRIGSDFLKKNLEFRPEVYLSNPTYVNHYPIFGNNFAQKSYRYYNEKTGKLDLEGFLQDIDIAPERSIFLLHACAHNPTGMDPSKEQWDTIIEHLQRKKHIAFFDSAYQGFASGNPDNDAYCFRLAAEKGLQILVAQSYAKNMGLYGQRVGALNIITNSKQETDNVMSQLNSVIRPMYSNPPAYGARIVSTIFTNEALRSQWFTDVKTMADRIITCRKSLVQTLNDLGNPHDWSHITNQIGMFSFSRLTEEQVKNLRELSVYMNLDGRMSMSGVNQSNVEYLAKSIHKVTKHGSLNSGAAKESL